MCIVHKMCQSEKEKTVSLKSYIFLNKIVTAYKWFSKWWSTHMEYLYAYFNSENTPLIDTGVEILLYSK